MYWFTQFISNQRLKDISWEVRKVRKVIQILIIKNLRLSVATNLKYSHALFKGSDQICFAVKGMLYVLYALPQTLGGFTSQVFAYMIRWFQLSNKIIPIVRQGGSNCPIKLGHSGSLNHFFGHIGPFKTATGGSQFSK